MPTFSVDLRPEDMSEPDPMKSLWNRKLMEAMKPEGSGPGSGVYDSIRTRGFIPTEPIKVFQNEEGGVIIQNGHHRIATMADIEEKTSREHMIIPKVNIDPRTHWASIDSEGNIK